MEANSPIPNIIPFVGILGTVITALIALVWLIIAYRAMAAHERLAEAMTRIANAHGPTGDAPSDSESPRFKPRY